MVSSAANPVVLKEKARRLALVDMLLWNFHPEAESSKENRSVSTRNAWLASVVHAATGICMRAVSCHLTDIAFMLFQDTVPGPWQSTATPADTNGMLIFSNPNLALVYPGSGSFIHQKGTSVICIVPHTTGASAPVI